MILDDGYAWNGCVYRSLSQVAKAITGTNWNGHRFFGLKAVRDGASNRRAAPRQDRTHCSILACRQPSPLSRPQRPIVRRHLATKESASASANESARRPSGEGGPKAHRIGSRKDPRSDPSEFPRQAQAVQEAEWSTCGAPSTPRARSWMCWSSPSETSTRAETDAQALEEVCLRS